MTKCHDLGLTVTFGHAENSNLGFQDPPNEGMELACWGQYMVRNNITFAESPMRMNCTVRNNVLH